MAATNKKLLSILVPVFNEEENIRPLHEAIKAVMGRLSEEYHYEIIFTDNHSTDQSYRFLQELAKSDNNIKVIRFSRNFGYQRSIYTGYMYAKGDAAVQLDCDMQDSPDLIPEFVRLWESGHQVIYGVRRSRKERWWINTLRRMFYALIDFLSEDKLPRDVGDFRLVDRKVIEELKKIDDQQPYLRGAIATMGFSQIGVSYDRDARVRGESKFSMSELVKLAIDGILNHSVVPLRVATYIGIATSTLTFLGSIGYIIGKFIFGKDWPTGFATTTILLLTSLSLNALFLGIMGEYLGRIYQQVKKRPITIIEKAINLGGK